MIIGLASGGVRPGLTTKITNNRARVTRVSSIMHSISDDQVVHSVPPVEINIIEKNYQADILIDC
jgi:hypothetical protein